MSGIVGLINLDGAPVDTQLLEHMTASLAFRGPDRRATWSEGPAGFGHALLRTTYEAADEAQPLSFDGETWIVADARIDAREALVAKLVAKGRPARLDRPDVELILHAWAAFGPDCVQHLLGDFAFAVWEAAERRLTLVRDHMGVKPLFYAKLGSTVVLGNTLECVRLHPGVANTLDELAIADFLLFGHNLEEATTSYRAIRRVPRAHVHTWTPAGDRAGCYWTLPVEDTVYRRRAADYTDEFSHLLGQAVGDRLRAPRVGVLMSGGLDSTTLAAEARRQLGRDVTPAPVHAFTAVAGPDDEEGYFASLAADYLGIGITIRDSRGEQAALMANTPPSAGPEPQTSGSRDPDQWSDVAAFSRVLFYGEGPDNALRYDWRGHIGDLVRRRRFARAAADLMLDRLAQPRIPGLATARHAAGGQALPDFLQNRYPPGLNPDLEARLGLRERWERVHGAHPKRDTDLPPAHRAFDLALWRMLFDSLDPGVTGAPLEVRHPFLDLRLLAFMLSVPALPWRRRKFLIRRAMRGRLPQAVLTRDKTPLAPRLSNPPKVHDSLMALGPETRAFFGQGVERPRDIPDPSAAARAETLNVWVSGRMLASTSIARAQRT